MALHFQPGTPGPQGPAGPEGPQGPQGLTGAEGPSGPTGGEGPAGAEGPQGLTGPQGEDGAAGAQGPEGQAGPQGLQGEAGLQGIQGIPGQQGVQGPAGSFPSVSAVLGGNVTMTNQNQFYPAVNTGVLQAGTYLVTGIVTCGRAATGATNYTAKLWNGTVNYASAQINVPSLNPHVTNLAVAALVVLAAPTTITLACAASVASSLIYAAATVNGAGNTATQITALKIA